MKARQQRMLAVGLAAAGLAIAAALTLRAFQDNIMFFVDISDVMAGKYPHEHNFRIGGLVVDGSVKRATGSLDIAFNVTDLRCVLPVTYSGVLPDLFREGQGVVAHGHLSSAGIFVADQILAKHDEKYTAPEVAASLAKHVDDKTATIADKTTECQQT